MASVGRAFTSYNNPAHALYSAPWRHNNSAEILHKFSYLSREPLCPWRRLVGTILNSILEKTSPNAAEKQETEGWFLLFVTVIHWLSFLGFLGIFFIEYWQHISSFVLSLFDPFLAWYSAVINGAAATIRRSHLGKKNVEIAVLKLKLEDRLETLAKLENILKHTRKCLARESRQYRETLANSRADLNAFRAHLKDFEARFNTMREDNRILVESVDELVTKVEDLNISNQILWVDNENLWRINEDLARTNENWRKTMHAFQAADPLKFALETELAELQAAYNHVIASNIELREGNSRCINAGICCVSIANAQASTEAEDKLDNALHEVSMLRREVSDKEKGIKQLTRIIQHIEVRLNTALSDVACLQNAPSIGEIMHPFMLRNEGRLVQTLTAKNRDLEIENERLQQSLGKAELELRRCVGEEIVEYPIQVSEGFGNKGFEVIIEEEAGYVSTETVELSESEDEIVEGFEEVLLENVKEKCETGSFFFREEGE